MGELTQYERSHTKEKPIQNNAEKSIQSLGKSLYQLPCMQDSAGAGGIKKPPFHNGGKTKAYEKNIITVFCYYFFFKNSWTWSEGITFSSKV